MSETSEKTPEWLVLLENKKKRHNRLAHEIGAGAPCLSCGDSCPGLDLHFWRKLCRNCKCKKEEHDVKDDEGYEQFEILLGPASKKRKRGACLNIKVPGVDNAKTVKSAEVAFDWVPPNVSDDVAVEYMKQLPTAKLPISGSDGALYRRQQLERQVPIHDLDASRCHNLTPQEVEGLKKYLDNLKSNVVGQGRVTKVPLLHADVRWASEAFGQKSLPASHSADSIRGIPPSAFSAPRPFHPAVPRMPADTEDEDFPPPPPPLPNTMPPNLKKPSNFAPSWKPYHNPESQTSYSEALPGKPYTSSGFERAGPTDRLSQKGNSQQSASVGHQQFGTLPGESVSSLPADASVSHTLHPESHTAYSDVVPGKPSFASAKHHRSGSGVADPVSQRGQQQGDVGHQRYDVEHQHYGLMPENTAATLPADATFAHTVHPDYHTVYSESVPGKHSALSPEYRRTGLRVVDPVSPKQQSEWMEGMSTKRSESIPGYNVLSSPADATVSLATHPMIMSVSTNVPGVSPAMVATSLSQSCGAREGFKNESVPHNKNTGTLHAGVVAGSRYPSGQECYQNACPDKLPYNEPVKQWVGKDIPQEGNLGYSMHPAEKEDIYSQQPGALLQSDTVNIKSPVSRTQLGNSEGTSSLLGHKPYYMSHPVESTSCEPIAARNAGSSHWEVGVNNLSPGKTVPTKHIPGESHGDAHRQQKGRFADTVGTGHDPFGMPEALPAKSSIYSSLGPHGETVFSEGVPTDALPKSALAMQQHRHDAELGELSSHMAEMKTDDTPAVQQPQFNCKECKGAIQAGDVAVFADRAGEDVAWHPSCFVCTTCKELLVDLIYFFNKGQVYCGRHYAELLKIPRCFACDELIFVNEYTMAEGQAFHVKHFCCYECDIPLGGMKYVPVDGQPVCLDCFQEKYGKSCHACGKKIGASDQRVSWNELHWHVSGDCFSCFSCHKSLLGGRFAVKKNQPFCSKECVLASGIL
ncbi:uncharacterized protein LOC124711450 isoform X1 [Schistocerca piceifrons]|uniref:uncharacterized protein LOC124711450 isoform X1 n=1 Tax=Schistocerca piceifrons TaxID=274613 RepID=UPI001F5F45C8|nr:uncharacterized protein LOC124711450 isoform X1 [Schistocerca piceifrons]XP_047097490.1 uncharacterized protein LOC124711450 isoform X1 [Schistocerca piceifrons]